MQVDMESRQNLKEIKLIGLGSGFNLGGKEEFGSVKNDLRFWAYTAERHW